MTHRERVLTALEHREPDRVPIDLGSTWVSTMAKSTHEALKQHLGLEGGDSKTAMLVLQTARVDERILHMFETDFRPLCPGAPVGWRMPKEGGYYFDMVNHPLRDASLETIKRYRGPDVHDPGRIEGLADRAKKLISETDYAVFPEIGVPGMS
jgi:uroporphyrinogen decarboxylase